MEIRIGFGYDVHRFKESKPLILGGVVFPEHRGLKGHSDADVLVHAICDALLGAANLGDLGKHFPDTDPQYSNVSSLILLKDVMLAEGKVCSVNERLCSGCGICALLCPYSAIELDEERKVANVNKVLCKGCGVCASSCRCGAIDIDGFSDEQILAMIKAV